MRTNIMVEFIIEGKEFDVDDVSEVLQLIPSSIGLKGEEVNENIIRESSFWIISTDYEDSLNPSIQIEKILNLVKDKKSELMYLKKKYEIKYGLMVVVNIEKGAAPTITLDKDLYQFLLDIDGFYEVDTYILSNK